MDESAVSTLAKGQAFLFGGVTVCVVVRPDGLRANNGISFYGVHPVTVPVLAAGLLGAAWYTRRGLRLAAPSTPAPDLMRRSGNAFALLLVGILVTPYTIGVLVDWTHRGLGSALFVLQLVLGAQLVRWTRDPLAAAYWSVELLGGILSAVYVLRVHGYLLETQLLFQLGFGALVLRTTRRLSARPVEVGSPT